MHPCGTAAYEATALPVWEMVINNYCFLQAVPGTLHGCTLVALLLVKPQPCQWLWPAVLGTLHAGTPWATLVHLIWLLPWHQCHPHWKHVAMCLVLHPCAPCNHVAIACLCKVTHVNFILSIFAVTLAVKNKKLSSRLGIKCGARTRPCNMTCANTVCCHLQV